MKKFALIIICLLATGVSFAQLPFTFGPKVGANYSALKPFEKDNRLNSNYLTGFAVGAFGRVNLGKLYIQPEFYYTRNGSNMDMRQNATTTTVNENVKRHSFDIPVLLGYKIINLKVANVRVMGGPVASYMLKEGKKGLQVLNPDNYAFNKSNLGFQAGVGIDVANFTLDVRYEGGLNKINSNFNPQSNLFHIGLGFKFL